MNIPGYKQKLQALPSQARSPPLSFFLAFLQDGSLRPSFGLNISCVDIGRPSRLSLLGLGETPAKRLCHATYASLKTTPVGLLFGETRHSNHNPIG